MDPKRRFDSGPRHMDNRTPPPDVIPVQNGQPLPQDTALPPALQRLIDHLNRFGTLPAGTKLTRAATPEERAAKLKKRADRKLERDRKRDARRRNRR